MPTGSIDSGGDTHDATVVVADEREDFVALLARLDVSLDAAHGVEQRGARLIDMAVSLGDVVDDFFAEVGMLAQDYMVDAIVCCGVVGDDGVRGHIGGDAAAALDESQFTHVDTLVEDDIRREDGAHIDGDATGTGDAIAQDTSVVDVGVVTDVRLRHDEDIVVDASCAVVVDAAVDDYLLADDGVVTDDAVGLLTLPTEVLGVGAHDGSLVHLAVVAHACAMDDAGIGENLATVADNDVLVDASKGVNDDVLAQLG